MDRMSSTFKQIWRSERLAYRGMEETEECKNLVHQLLGDPVVYGLSMPVTQKPATKKDNDKITSDIISRSILAVLICLPKESEDQSDHPIGYIQMSKKLEHAAGISLCLLPDHQDKGYGREAINWAMDWAFRYANLHRVAIGTVSYNERAMHLYRSIGFVEEGRQREMVYMDMEWFDLVEYGILKREWKSLRDIK